MTDIKKRQQTGGRHASSLGPVKSNPRSGDQAAATNPHRGWILYDGQCPSCTASARHFDRLFRRRGFLFLPLQTSWVMERLGLDPHAALEEMHVLTSGGRDIAGADAVIFLARQIWWAWPLAALARLPVIHTILDRGYRWVAAHRGCDHIACDPGARWHLSRRLQKTAGPSRTGVWRQALLEVFPAWIGLIAFPASVLPLREHVAPWQFMWLMTAAIFFGCKWLTAWRAQTRTSDIKASRAFGYFFAWPGMDAEKFLFSKPALTERDGLKPSSLSSIACDWSAIGKIFLGTILLFGVARLVPHPLLAGWIGMVGMILILHFGLFQLLAGGWRKAGINIEPIMNAPLQARSLTDFWGRRWNSAFNRLAFDFVFQPIARRHLQGGTQVALLAAFLLSGTIHELVISLPAGAGYGLPTLYFVLQGIGILVERSLPQIRGRIFTLLIAAVPAFWLFHPPFVHKVILPFMKAIGAL